MHRLPGQQEKEHRGEAPLIALAVHELALAPRLLRRHERRRSDHRVDETPLRDVARQERARHAKVEDLEPAVFRKKDIRGLEIAVDEAGAVHGAKDVGNLVGPLQSLREIQPPILAQAKRFKRLPLQQIHHQVWLSGLRVTVVEDTDDARVLHGVGEVPLGQKALAEIAVHGQDLAQDLHRGDGTVAVRGASHDGHGTGAELDS